MIAGEASGDLHGGRLAAALKAREPSMEVFGIGGERMAAAGMTLMRHVKDVSFMGFSEVVKHLGDIRRLFDDMVAAAQRERPDLVVLIDYPGFNLRLGKKLKALGFRIFYYIAPQVWAWHQSRAREMAAFVERMAVLFPFEVEFFTKYGIDARFVGHPLLDGLEVRETKEAFCERSGLSAKKPILAVFPGSRRQEIDKLMPVVRGLAELLAQRHPEVQIAVSCAETIAAEQIASFCSVGNMRVVRGNYELMAFADAAVVKSGTSTLEAACLGTPFCIMYKVSPVSFFIGKRVVKIPFIGLVNIVAGKEAVKEFIQKRASAEEMMPEVERCLFDGAYRGQMIAELSAVRGMLGGPGAAERTARGKTGAAS